jgi:hypothetical protein
MSVFVYKSKAYFMSSFTILFTLDPIAGRFSEIYPRREHKKFCAGHQNSNEDRISIKMQCFFFFFFWEFIGFFVSAEMVSGFLLMDFG